MSANPDRTESVFTEAVARSVVAERIAYLDEACANDPALRKRVDGLLRAHDQSQHLLDRPAPAALDRTQALSFAERPGLVIGGRYKLLEEIGEGGMGTVWVAEQSEPVRRKVALKLIKAGMDSKSVLARFEAERQALAVMDHPNIAKVLDGGLTDRGRPYFAMEYVKGVPITEYCDAARLNVAERLQLFAQVCQAVQHAHQKGIIHRDLKPSNILVAPYDDKPVPKVIDFGLAKAISQSLTERTVHIAHDMVLGTPLYMSPEQAQLNNIDVDTRTDIYSLGVLLYELLTGTTPLEKQRFREAAWDEVRRIIREEEPQRPSMRLSSVDTLPSLAAGRHTEPSRLTKLVRGELDWIVMKALEKDRARRYETAIGFAADVNRYLSGEPVLAAPPSTSYRLRKFVRRNRMQVIAGSIVFLALVAGIIGTSIGFFHAENQRQIAVQREGEAKLSADKERQAGEREASQRAIAVEQRVLAEKARDRTRDVLDAMTSTATSDSLATQTEVSADQKKFLTEVLTYYREFAGEKGDDQQTRVRTANAAFRVGEIEDRLGRDEEATRAFQMARAGYQSLVQEFPDVTDYWSFLAMSHTNLAIFLADQRRDAEAVEQIRLAQAIHQKLAADFPDDAINQWGLARTHLNLGNFFRQMGKWAEAEEQYRKGLVIREKLVADSPDNSAFCQDLAYSHNHLAGLLEDLGNRTEAEAEYRQAVSIREELAARFPLSPVHRNELGASYYSLGSFLFGMEKNADAEETLRRALSFREGLVAEFPSVPGYRRNLSSSHDVLGMLLQRLGNLPEAEKEIRQALEIKEKLATEFAAIPTDRRQLASSYTNLGNVLTNLKKRAEAEEQYRKVFAIQEQLVAEFPGVTEYQIDLGGTFCNLGILVRDAGRAEESLGWFDKAIATLAPLHRAEPREVTVKQFLLNSYWGRAKSNELLKRYADAIPDWDRVIELSLPEKQYKLRVTGGTIRQKAGMDIEALAEIAALTASIANEGNSQELDAVQWYNFACSFAVASDKFADKQLENADRAMELLKRAIQAGWKDAAHMEKDTDLDALRERDDFRKLLAELAETVAATDKTRQP